MISIVILSYRNPALLRLCLKSLVETLDHTSEYEVIVVDNATIPETRNVVTEEFSKKIASLSFIPITKNSGYTHGVNVGLKAAKGEFIIALNYDIVVMPGTIQKLAEYLSQNPRVGLVGPQLLNFDNTHQDSCFRFKRPMTILSRRLFSILPFAKNHVEHFAMHDTDLSTVQEVDWVSGAALMTTRQALECIGYLDEKLFHYLSDVDWAMRFWENGYTVVYYPLTSLYHYLGRTSKGRYGALDPLFNRATRWHIKDAINYFIKHGITGKRPQPHDHRQPFLITS